MKKFFKKPLNIASVALMVVGIVVMVALLIIPHGVTYTYTKTSGDIEYTTTYTFKKDKVEVKYTAGSLSYEDEFNYAIEKGELCTVTTIAGSEVKTPVMKINAFKITDLDGESDEAFTCKLNVTIMIVACAMAVVGLAGTVYGALTLKKKKK